MAGKFKLQTVLNYRNSLEDQAQQVLASTLQRESEFTLRLQQQQQNLQQYDQLLKQRQQEGLTVAEMDLYESQIQHCRYQIKEIQGHLQQLQQQIVVERRELLHAARERQVMEKLKDKQEAAYQQELSHQERVMLDEISLRNKGIDS